jgi:hypothetical protein
VEKLTGDVHIEGRKVRIARVRGMRGAAECTVDGTLDNLGTDNATVELDIKGQNLPIDTELAEAAGDAGRAVLAALRPVGSTEQFSARIWKTPGKPLDYHVVAKLEDVTFNPESFPYEVTGTAGVVTFRPKRAIIEQLSGLHGDSPVTVTGQVLLDKEGFGVDIETEARNITLDQELYHALPDKLKGVWDQFKPTGRADMGLSLTHHAQVNPGKSDYRFVLRPRGMGITYSEFPYPLRGITGRLVATSGQVLLDELTCEDGAMSGTLRGGLWIKENRQRAELTVRGANVPITAELLETLPEELAPLTGRFEPGGTCNVNLHRFHFSRPAGASETQPFKTLWDVAGTATLRDATLNIGFGKKVVTGKVAGEAERDSEGLSINADVEMERVVVGAHQVTDLSGKLLKSSASPVMRVDDISGKSHGGAMAGSAIVTLTDPLQYGISLSVDRIRVEELFEPEGSGEEPGTRVTGLLDGRIELRETPGKIETRQAKGILRIVQGKLYKLPVLLDLLTIVFLTLPHETAFTEGAFLYHLRGDQLVLDEIHLLGSQVSLVGSGTMDMKTQKLKLTFLTSPGRLPRLHGLVGEVLEGIAREIMEIRVTGTLKDPKMHTRTLRSLEEAVRQMIAPASEED